MDYERSSTEDGTMYSRPDPSGQTPSTDSLSDFGIEVEFRTNPNHTLSEPPNKTRTIRVSLLLRDEYRLLPSNRIRAGQLSWDKFVSEVESVFGVRPGGFDCELGFCRSSAIPRPHDEYAIITSELSFQNAIGVMFNQRQNRLPVEPVISFHLWKPKPRIDIRQSLLPVSSTARTISFSDRIEESPTATLRTCEPIIPSEPKELDGTPVTKVLSIGASAALGVPLTKASFTSTCSSIDTINTGHTDGDPVILDVDADRSRLNTVRTPVLATAVPKDSPVEVTVPKDSTVEAGHSDDTELYNASPVRTRTSNLPGPFAGEVGEVPLPRNGRVQGSSIENITELGSGSATLDAPAVGDMDPNRRKKLHGTATDSDAEFVPETPDDADSEQDEFGSDSNSRSRVTSKPRGSKERPIIIRESLEDNDNQTQNEETTSVNEPSLSDYLINGGINPGAIEMDAYAALKFLRVEKPIPKREEFESDEDFDAEMREYVEFLREDALAKMQEGCESEACMQFSGLAWEKACLLVHHDPKEHKPGYIVNIPGGFGRKLLPVQMHTVMHTLHEIHGLAGGCIIGHEMGIGKTTIAVAIHHVQHVFNKMWSHIRSTTTRHMHAQAGFGDCPSNSIMLKMFGYDCPCSKDSRFHWLKERLGTTVALVPRALLTVWTAEFAACYPSSLKTDQICIKAHAQQTIPQDVADLLKGNSQVVAPNMPDIVRPVLSNSRVFVVSTSESFESNFLNSSAVGNSKTFDYVPSGRKKPVKQNIKWCVAIVATVIKDEFQSRRTEGLKPIAALHSKQHTNLMWKPKDQWGDKVPHRFALIPMSGTPLTTGPSDIAEYLQQMIIPSWQHDPELKKWMKREIFDLGARWEKWVKLKDPEADDSNLQVFEAFTPLVERFMIRWTTSSSFRGEPPVVVPKNYYSEIECDHGDYWNNEVNNLHRLEEASFNAREEAHAAAYRKHYKSMKGYTPLKRTADNVFYRSRVCASFPFLMRLKKADGTPLKLTQTEWDENIKSGLWKPETSTDPYFANLAEIVESSGKLRRIDQMIGKYKNFIDGEGKLARQIFYSRFFVGAYIMYLRERYIKKVDKFDLIFLYVSMQGKVNKELDRFHVNLNIDKPPSEQRTSRYIFATTCSCNKGVTLAEAISVGILEPDYHYDEIVQACGRHCRQGNKNVEHGVESWLFYAKGNTVEDNILRKNKRQEQIQSAAKRKVNEIKASSTTV